MELVDRLCQRLRNSTKPPPLLVTLAQFLSSNRIFNKMAAGVFGSGWAMVLVDRTGTLSLVARPNQDSPLMEGKLPLFGNDVWEHVYYLKYQNRRPDYLTAWWNVVDWSKISERYTAAVAGTLAI
jgi:superoxide dismutase, Fe-Mn family